MTRVKEEVQAHKRHLNQLIKSYSGNLKAARIFPSVAASQQGGNNARWEQALQNFSDYLIRY